MASFHSWKRNQLDDNRKVFEQGPQAWLEQSVPDSVEEVIKTEKKEDIHIFVCTDEADLRPLAVLINSSMANTP